MANTDPWKSQLAWLLRLAGAVCLMMWGASCVLPPHSAERPLKRALVIHHAAALLVGTQKWNPVWWLGNADDPVPPEWYRPNQKGRRALWQLRNPLHNFTFYVIGVADADFIRYGSEPEAVFSRDGGWNWTVIEKGWLRLPFVSYEGTHLRFYALWRERGNFGLKATLRKKKG